MPDVQAQPQGQGSASGQPMKSFRQIDAKVSDITYDKEKAVLTIPDQFGYKIQFHVEPLLSINQYTPFMNNVPEYQTNIMMRPVHIARDEKSLNQKAIQEKLKTMSVVPNSIDYENFSIGFVYATAENPMNHKWMLEYRKAGNIFYAQHFEGVRLENVDIGTMSWNQGIWHGRFTVKKGAFKTIVEESPNQIVIKGKAPSKHTAKGDTSLIGEGVDRLKFRYNIKTDIWYAEMLGPDGATVSPTLEFKSILGENVTMRGDIDWGHQKPKVSVYMDVSKIKEIKLMSDTLIIQGK